MPAKPPRFSLQGTPRQQRQRYDRQRAAEKRFYSCAAWRRLRLKVLRERPLCAHCETENIVRPASEVDHIIDRRRRPDLALAETNLQPLCKTHHSRKTAHEHLH